MLAACNGNISITPEQFSDNAQLVEYKFNVGAETKASISDAGVFSWAAGDEIAVWDAQNNKFDKFTADAAGATTTITGTGAADANYTTAYYPYSVASDAAGENSIAWPSSYESAAAAAKGFPMMAVNDNGQLNFKHLGALLKISINDLPAGVTSLVFNANVGVSGTLAVDSANPAEPFCALGSSASSISLPTEAVAGDAVFYLPLPVGTLTGGFSIDFKITSTNNKVVGTKATTSNVSILRGKLIPMKAFTPDFNWPSDTDAFDSGVAKNASKTATYPAADRKTEELIALYGENGLASGKTLQNKEGFASSVTLDKVTYCAHFVSGTTYHKLTFNGNRFDTASVRGPREWLNESEYGTKTIPADLYFSFKVNRPGKMNYACVLYNKLSDRPVTYKLAIIKTVDGVTSASNLIEFTPDFDMIHDRKTDGSTPSSECYHEFVVTADDLLGIDKAATLYLYGYQKSNSNLTVSHYPFTWTPSAAE